MQHSTYEANLSMETLVRNAVLAEQMNKKRSSEQAEADAKHWTPPPTKKSKRSDLDCEASQCNVSVDDAAKAHSMPPSNRAAVAAPAGRKRDKDGFQYPVEPRIIAVVKKPRTVMNHSYRDFSKVPAELTYERQTNIEDMSVAEKLHDILSIEEYSHFVSWMSHGRAFKIHVPKVFEEQICPKYFGHSRYSSFLRLLNNHGFKHISQGPDRNAYYHETFLRGMPWLSKYMPKPTNARHLMPDPENEPNFYELSTLFPLVGDEHHEIVIPIQPAPTKTSPALQPVASSPVATAVAAHAGFPRGLNPTQAFGLSGMTADRLLQLRPPAAHNSILPQPHHNMDLTSTRLVLQHRQRLLNQAAAVAALEGQAHSEGHALLNSAAWNGNLSLNGGGNYLRGFPF